MKHAVSPAQAREVISAMQKQRILVIGDLMLDEFIYGKVSRISPEAPVPVVRVTSETAYPGGAANVARNLSDFGIHACICGLLGRDSTGKSLFKLLAQAGIATDGVFFSAKFPTIVKTRIIAMHQQVVRVDREQGIQAGSGDLARLARFFAKSIPTVDAVIIEDYGKGFITQSLVDLVVSAAGRHDKIIAVDPNPNNPLQWHGVTMLKPNRQEAFAAAGLPYSDSEADLRKTGEILLQKWQIPYLLITLGEEGMMLFHPPDQPYHTPTRAREVFDVSGAGDTAIAFFTAALAAGFKGALAAMIANHAAAVVVAKLGTATLRPEELAESLARNV